MTLEALTTLVTAISLLILLAMASMRFGVDSREWPSTKEVDLARRGII
jgi:hypothetical protein